jgi:predicted CopG family antitoxin
MIRVRESTHKELVKLAKYGDAMSDIIDQLLASYKDKSKDVSRNVSRK